MSQPDDAKESVSRLLRDFKTGDKEAADELTRRYFQRVVAAASSRIRAQGLRAVDGDDVAASVFETLWARAADKRFNGEDLQDREDLWSLLCRLMRSKTIDATRREKATKRGGGMVRGESVFLRPGGGGIDHVAGPQWLPVDAASLTERYSRLMDALKTDIVREIVLLRLEGYAVAEIAKKVGLSTRSVGRKLEIARNVWSQLDELDH